MHKSADPLLPSQVVAEGTGVEVIGIHDGPWQTPGTGPRTGPVPASLGTGPGTVVLLPGPGHDRWYPIPLQTAAETWRHLKPLQTPVSLFPDDRTKSQVPVTWAQTGPCSHSRSCHLSDFSVNPCGRRGSRVYSARESSRGKPRQTGTGLFRTFPLILVCGRRGSYKWSLSFSLDWTTPPASSRIMRIMLCMLAMRTKGLKIAESEGEMQGKQE